MAATLADEDAKPPVAIFTSILIMTGIPIIAALYTCLIAAPLCLVVGAANVAYGRFRSEGESNKALDFKLGYVALPMVVGALVYAPAVALGFLAHAGKIACDVIWNPPRTAKDTIDAIPEEVRPTADFIKTSITPGFSQAVKPPQHGGITNLQLSSVKPLSSYGHPAATKHSNECLDTTKGAPRLILSPPDR